jgi:ceramide glucosyltransferase
VTAVTLAAGLLSAASLVGVFYLAAAALAVRGFVRGGPAAGGRERPGMRPPVTIMKPLHGADYELAANLRRFCTQTYPTVQIVFGVRDEGDAAVPVVRRLMTELPDADIALVIDARLSGSNGKVGNLINMLPAARHDMLVIADSDMSVGPDYLDALVAELTRPGVGLVTCLYRGRPATGLWSRLGAMFISYGFLPSVLVGRLVGSRDGCFGATMALSRATLARIGGFESLKDLLADDYALGAKVRAIGLELVLSPYLVDTVVDEPSLRHLLAHELRWARTMRAIAPAGYAASIVTLPLPFALLATLLAPSLGLPCLILALAARLAQTAAIARLLGLDSPPAWLVPARDLLSFGVLIASFCGTAISWRDQRFRVDAEGRLSAEREFRA